MKNYQTIILDLDGPILNGKKRHYECYRKILAENTFVPIDIDSYWEMKRKRARRDEILRLSGAESLYDEFLHFWLERIEKPEYLSLDVVQSGAEEKLREWQLQGKRLALATMRKNETALLEQLKNLRLIDFFEQVIVCHHQKNKADFVLQNLSINKQTTLWIGDTEADIYAAKTLDCDVWALSCGLRTTDYLSSLAPTYLSEWLRCLN